MELGLRDRVLLVGGRQFPALSPWENAHDPIVRGTFFVYPAAGSAALKPIPIRREENARPLEKRSLRMVHGTRSDNDAGQEAGVRFQVVRTDNSTEGEESPLRQGIVRLVLREGLSEAHRIIAKLNDRQLAELAKEEALLALLRKKDLGSIAEAIKERKTNLKASDILLMNLVLLSGADATSEKILSRHGLSMPSSAGPASAQAVLFPALGTGQASPAVLNVVR